MPFETRPLHELDGAYAGRTIWVVATGTSVRGFPFRRLSEETTIACNDAVFWFKPNVHIFIDGHLVNRYHDGSPWRANEHKDPLWAPHYPNWHYADGQVVVCHKSTMKLWEDIPKARETAKRVKLYGFEKGRLEEPMASSALWCKATVTASAIHLAVRLGAQRINVLGLDGWWRGPERYWWQRFEERHRKTELQHGCGMWKSLNSLAAAIDGKVAITNYSESSVFPFWPRRDWREEFG